MADCDGCIILKHQCGKRFADNVAATDYHAVFSGNLNIILSEHFHYAGRRAGQKDRVARPELSDIDIAKAVNVLLRVNGFNNGLFVNVLRQRQLAEDSVNKAVLIKPLNKFKQFPLSCLSRKRKLKRLYAHCGALFLFIVHINS